MSTTTDALRALALRFEADTGQDSIDTMETHYVPHDNDDVLECVMPHCRFRRSSPYAMFRHVHFGNHGQSYGMTFEQFTALALSEFYPDRDPTHGELCATTYGMECDQMPGCSTPENVEEPT